MTFVVGFHCFNGLVLCADSEEGNTINKTYVDKLYFNLLESDWGVCFGGAGDSVAIDKFKSKLVPILRSSPQDQINIELNTEKTLEHMKDMYNLDFEILIGGSNLHSHEVFLNRSYEGGHILRPIEEGHFACIGMDTSLAQFFLSTVFDPLMGITEALRLGIWVTALSKIHMSSVSGPTLAFSYKKGDTEWHRYWSAEVDEIEDMFGIAEVKDIIDAYWKRKNPDIWKNVSGLNLRDVDY